MATVGFSAVSPEGRVEDAIAWLWPETASTALEPLAEVLREAGAVPAIQLGHGGRQVSPKVIGQTPVAPSAVAPAAHVSLTPQALAEDDIAQIVAAFGAAACCARDSGFKAVELHGGHGYLVQQFLSAEANLRTDRYGGPTVAARSRFGLGGRVGRGTAR